MSKVLAKCTQEYQDENDLYLFEIGELAEDDIKVHKVGDIEYVVEEYYNKDYYEVIEPKVYEED